MANASTIHNQNSRKSGRDSDNLQRIGDRMQKIPGRMGFGLLRMSRSMRRNALRLLTPYGVRLMHRAMTEFSAFPQDE